MSKEFGYVSYINGDHYDNPYYWLREAMIERAFAKESNQSIESKKIHLRHAESYESTADFLIIRQSCQ